MFTYTHNHLIHTVGYRISGFYFEIEIYFRTTVGFKCAIWGFYVQFRVYETQSLLYTLVDGTQSFF